ncbi:MAG: ParB/RepB/Spo0J family partition protein [Isosphaeraceae bacterium]
MGKLDKILSTSGANIDASMGAGRTPRPLHGTRELHGATGASGASSSRLQGLIRSKDAAEIPVDRIDRDPAQPREDFDEEGLDRLAESLRTRGQLQPIRVRWDEPLARYLIVCGERRWRAAKRAGLPTLSCVIMDRPADPAELLALQLVENALREDLRPVEQARAFRALMDRHNWGGRQLAQELCLHPSAVTRALALLELPETVRDQVEQGALPASVAYEVSKLPDPTMQRELADAVVGEGLTRSEVTEAVRAVRSRRPGVAKPPPTELDLGDGVIVTIRYRKASSVSPAQALRRALKLLLDREREGEAA